MPETLLTVPALTKAIFAARERFVPDRDADPTRYVKLWKEDDVGPEGPVKAMTLILRTRGCTWDYQHSCTMCGYFTDVLPKKLTAAQLIQQWDRAEAQYAGERLLKVYTGGNFLDAAEVFPDAQREILTRAAARFGRIAVETRPEYITPERIGPLLDITRAQGARLQFAIGLESSSDVVCREAINKGYGFREFVQGAETARRLGAEVKAYLLLKPPFLTEDETVEDMVTSIRDAGPYSDVISVNPTNVQKHTLVDRLHRHREYRPPWLWSVLEVLRRGRPLFQGILKSDPVGGGTPRGAHNCRTCDERILPLIERYNSTQDIAFVRAAEETPCRCRAQYQAVRELEGHLGASAFVD